jgi:hypothetical protein
MSDLDDAVLRLERAVARLERAPRQNRPDPAAVAEAARLAEESAAEDVRVRQLTSAIASRVEAALDKIGQALGEEA